MVSFFDDYGIYENPDFFLHNPDRKFINGFVATNRHLTLRFNDLSELSFDIYQYLDRDGKAIEQPAYSKIETRRLVRVENIGWFRIADVSENEGESGAYKTVRAESHQSIFKDVGFVAEDRIYKFYNSEDPHDERYDANDDLAIPSICGQLYQQLGIISSPVTDNNDSDFEVETDYEDWTIVWIQPSLKYDPNDASKKICRTLKKSDGIYGYEFMVNTVSDAFHVFFDFDFEHHAIKVRSLDDVAKKSDVYLSYDDLLKEVVIDEKSEDIITVLTCEGGNGLGIGYVNPMGTEYICDFSYYMGNEEKGYPWMSKELTDRLIRWKKQYDEELDSYHTLSSALYEYDKKIVQLEEKKIFYEKKLTDLEVARDQYINGEANKDDFIMVEEVKVNESSIYPDSHYYAANLSEVDFSMIEVQYAIFEDCQHANREGDYLYPDVFVASKLKGNNLGKRTIVLYRNGAYGDYIDTKTEYYYSGKRVHRGKTYDAWRHIGSNDIDFTWESSSKKYLLTNEVVDITTDAYGNETYSWKSSVLVSKKFTETAAHKCYKTIPPFKDDCLYVNAANKVVNVKEAYMAYLEPGSGGEGVYFKDYVEYEDTDDDYCKLNATTDENGDVKVLGFKRYVKYSQIGKWVEYVEQLLDIVKIEIANLNKERKNYQSQIDNMTEWTNVLKYVKNEDAKANTNLSKELSYYWVTGLYTNENLAKLEDETVEDNKALAEELLKCGQIELKYACKPSIAFSVTSANFLNIWEFRHFAKSLGLGKLITIEKRDGTVYQPAIIELSFSLENPEDFAFVCSEATDFKEWGYAYADLLGKASTTARTVSANWDNLIDYTKDKDRINNLLTNTLDRTLRYGMENSYNQEFIIDNTGILGRKRLGTEKVLFEENQLRLTNNLLMFTDDNWQTIRTALGKISYTDGVKDDGSPNEKTAYGLAAEVIVGDLILGKHMKITSGNNGCVSITSDGIKIIDDYGVELFNFSRESGDFTTKIYGEDYSTFFTQTSEKIGFLISDNEGKYSIKDDAIAAIVLAINSEGNTSALISADKITFTSGDETSTGDALYSAIVQQKDAISLLVKDGNINSAGIIAAINNDGSSTIKLNADRIEISRLLSSPSFTAEKEERVVEDVDFQDELSPMRDRLYVFGYDDDALCYYVDKEYEATITVPFIDTFPYIGFEVSGGEASVTLEDETLDEDEKKGYKDFVNVSFIFTSNTYNVTGTVISGSEMKVSHVIVRLEFVTDGLLEAYKKYNPDDSNIDMNTLLERLRDENAKQDFFNTCFKVKKAFVEGFFVKPIVNNGMQISFANGNTYIMTKNFHVSGGGNLWAQNATLEGNVTATSGYIGGLKIKNGSIIGDKISIDKNGSITMRDGVIKSENFAFEKTLEETFDFSSGSLEKIDVEVTEKEIKHYAIDNETSLCNCDYTATIDLNHIKIPDGSVIDSWKVEADFDPVDKNKYYKTTISEWNVKYEQNLSKGVVLTLKGKAYLAYKGHPDSISDEFYEDSVSRIIQDKLILTAKYGSVNAKSGMRINVGALGGSIVSPNFSVSENGHLRATDADITGKITAESGEIAGLKISYDKNEKIQSLVGNGFSIITKQIGDDYVTMLGSFSEDDNEEVTISDGRITANTLDVNALKVRNFQSYGTFRASELATDTLSIKEGLNSNSGSILCGRRDGNGVELEFYKNSSNIGASNFIRGELSHDATGGYVTFYNYEFDLSDTPAFNSIYAKVPYKITVTIEYDYLTFFKIKKTAIQTFDIPGGENKTDYTFKLDKVGLFEGIDNNNKTVRFINVKGTPPVGYDAVACYRHEVQDNASNKYSGAVYYPYDDGSGDLGAGSNNPYSLRLKYYTGGVARTFKFLLEEET